MNLAIRSLNINRCMTMTLLRLAVRLNPMVRGWVTYYGAFHPETLKRFLVRIIDLDWGAGQRINTKGLEEINGKFRLGLSAFEKVITVDLSR